MTEIKTVRQLTSEVNRLFPAFGRQGRMLLLKPVEYLLRAIILDSSAFSKTSFCPTVFVQPLYEPVDHIFFTFGGRLLAPKGTDWDLQGTTSNVMIERLADAITKQAIPFLDRICKPIDLALACEKPSATEFPWPPDDINVLEAAAYSWLIAGNPRKALEKSERARREIARLHDDRAWVKALDSRMQQFIQWLTSGEDKQALEQLNEWKIECARALKLEEFLACDL